MKHRTQRPRSPVPADLLLRARLRLAATQRSIDLYAQSLDERQSGDSSPSGGIDAASDLADVVLAESVQSLHRLRDTANRQLQLVAEDEVHAQLRAARNESLDGRVNDREDPGIVDVVAREVS